MFDFFAGHRFLSLKPILKRLALQSVYKKNLSTMCIEIVLFRLLTKIFYILGQKWGQELLLQLKVGQGKVSWATKDHFSDISFISKCNIFTIYPKIAKPKISTVLCAFQIYNFDSVARCGKIIIFQNDTKIKVLATLNILGIYKLIHKHLCTKKILCIHNS